MTPWNATCPLQPGRWRWGLGEERLRRSTPGGMVLGNQVTGGAMVIHACIAVRTARVRILAS
ncbi:MAG: hypothetical protein U0531_05385 [Dehalococcoidia bacterium]